MPYNNIIDRTGADALIPESAATEIFKEVAEESAVMRLGRRLANIPQAQHRLPVLSALPTAYWVDGDTGLKQSSEVSWENKFINAEELAVIVPIPEAVLEDSAYDIWAETRPEIVAAIGKAWDEAVLHGTNAPSAFPTDIVAGATAAEHNVTESFGDDLYDAILGDGGVVSKIEADGYMSTGHVAAMNMRGKLRGLRDANGSPLFQSSMQGAGSYLLDGETIIFPRNGAFDTGEASLITGDWSKLVWAVRTDIRMKVLDQAVIQDGAGNIVYNLAQQDMVALRVTFRAGWQLPNPVNRLQPTEASRYPFAVLTP